MFVVLREQQPELFGKSGCFIIIQKIKNGIIIIPMREIQCILIDKCEIYDNRKSNNQVLDELTEHVFATNLIHFHEGSIWAKLTIKRHQQVIHVQTTYKKTGLPVGSPADILLIDNYYLAITNCFVTLPPSVAMFMK